MNDHIIIDTGPIVAYLRHNDKYHKWTSDAVLALKPPFCTCEPVVAEACFLLERGGGDSDDLLELIDRGLIVVSFQVSGSIKRIRKLMSKYKELPMSLADACLVVMSEDDESSRVFTLDSDFRVYRRLRRKVIPVLMP